MSRVRLSLSSSPLVSLADILSLNLPVALQALVTNSQLIIPAGRSKANLLGFFDCAYGEKKRLRVKYSFKGRRHEVELGDLDAVAAPLRSHVVE
jgi:DnaJ homolog subfamily C member 11